MLKDMTQYYRPPYKTMLELYLGAFCVDTRNEIRHAKLANLAATQNVAEELEKDKKASNKIRYFWFRKRSS